MFINTRKTKKIEMDERKNFLNSNASMGGSGNNETTTRLRCNNVRRLELKNRRELSNYRWKGFGRYEIDRIINQSQNGDSKGGDEGTMRESENVMVGGRDSTLRLIKRAKDRRVQGLDKEGKTGRSRRGQKTTCQARPGRE